MLLNGFANISLGLLYGFPIAEATRQRWTICQVSDIFSFLFDNDLEGIVGHVGNSSEPEVYHKRDQSPFATRRSR